MKTETRNDLTQFTSVLAAMALVLPVVQTARAASFTTINPMTTARDWQTATLLPNGKVLIAGGTPDRDPLQAAAFFQVPSCTTRAAEPGRQPAL